MVDWITHFLTIRPMRSLPRLRVVSVETQDSPAYRFDGMFRQSENHMGFQYTLSGEGCFRDTGNTYRLPQGTGFLCEVGDPGVSYFYPEGIAKPWHFIYMTFSGETAVGIVRDMIKRHGPIYALDKDCRLLKQLMKWSSYDGTSVKISAAGGAAQVFDLLTALGESKEASVLHTPSNRIVSEACSAIDDGLSQGVSVTELASHLSISREHLTRLFKSELGQTPLEYITRRKLLLACRLLKDSSLSGKVISERLGGITHQHFVRMFKKELKMTPSQFRRVGVIPMW